MKQLKQYGLLCLLLTAPLGAFADLTVDMHNTKTGQNIGVIHFRDTPSGLLISPDLQGLPPGPHGFHLHANPSCAQAGKAAGGHWDPKNTHHHLGPYGQGHLGDLPVLIVNVKGMATIPVLAPHLKVAELPGHSLMIHAGSDNYSDNPAPLGGGGARIACGVVGK